MADRPGEGCSTRPGSLTCTRGREAARNRPSLGHFFLVQSSQEKLGTLPFQGNLHEQTAAVHTMFTLRRLGHCCQQSALRAAAAASAGPALHAIAAAWPSSPRPWHQQPACVREPLHQQGSNAPGAEGLVTSQHWSQAGFRAWEADPEEPWSSWACRNEVNGLAGMLSRLARKSCWLATHWELPPGHEQGASHEPAADMVRGWCCSLLRKSCLLEVASVALLRCTSNCPAELLVADVGEAEPLAAECIPDWSLADALLPLFSADPRCAGCRWLLLLLADCSAGCRRTYGTAPCRPAEMGRAPAAGSPLALPLSADDARPGSPAPALPTCCPSASNVQASMDLPSSNATMHHRLSCCQQGRLFVCQMLSGRQKPWCWRDQLETDFYAACAGPAPRSLCWA